MDAKERAALGLTQLSKVVSELDKIKNQKEGDGDKAKAEEKPSGALLHFSTSDC